MESPSHPITPPQAGGRPVEIEGVIFDLDGTLTQPDAIDFAGIRRRIGMPEPGSILHWIDAHARTPEEAGEMRAVVLEEETLALDRMELADGFAQLIETLHARGATLRTGISTRNNGDALDAFRSLVASEGHGDANRLFTAQVARDHHSVSLGRPIHEKPSPEPAHEIVRMWGLGSRFPAALHDERDPAVHPSLLFIGDSIDDWRSGRRAGFRGLLLGARSPFPAFPAADLTSDLADVAEGLRPVAR